MGIFNELETDVSREVTNLEAMTPTAILAKLESLETSVRGDITAAKMDIAGLGSVVTSLLSIAQTLAPAVEALVPSETAEITAAIAALKAMAPPTLTTIASYAMD